MPRKEKKIAETEHVVEHLGTDYVFVVGINFRRKFSYEDHGAQFFKKAEEFAKKKGYKLEK